MKDSIMKNKSVLAVDSQMDLLQTLEEEILSACPECRLDMATTFEDGRQLMLLLTYDLVISDIMNAPGCDLIDLAASRNFPVLVLSDNGSSDEALNQSNGMKIRAVLPKENLNEIVPTVEEVLKYECMPGWKRALEKLDSIANFFLKILLPKSLTSTPPPERQIFY